MQDLYKMYIKGVYQKCQCLSTIFIRDVSAGDTNYIENWIVSARTCTISCQRIYEISYCPWMHYYRARPLCAMYI